MASRVDDMAKLRPLVEDLTSDLSPDSEERSSLLQQLSDLENEWDSLQNNLRSVCEGIVACEAK